LSGNLTGEAAIVGEDERLEAGRGGQQQASGDGALEEVIAEVECVQIG
jgi:hypothetical protein